jgi:hypothetical protein
MTRQAIALLRPAGLNVMQLPSRTAATGIDQSLRYITQGMRVWLPTGS